jgi:hypothetical protein
LLAVVESFSKCFFKASMASLKVMRRTLGSFW